MSFMSDLGARIVDNGFPILPIMPNTKKPGRFQRGSWGEYPDWSRHCDRPTRQMELSAWSTWPDAGIGVACGAVIGIDIDIVDDPKVAHQVEQLARRMLGDTPALRIGMAPKRLLVYRAAAPFAKFRRYPIEVLAAGSQFVAHGIHPETGAPYAWPNGSLADLDLDSLPVVTEDQARAFVAAAYDLLPASLRPATLGGTDDGKHVANGTLSGTYAAIEQALDHIPNDELPYDEWMTLGMAIKGALGDAGEALYARWSARAAKNVPATTAKSWAGYRPTSIGAGTVYYRAELFGWVPTPELTLNGAIAWEMTQHPAQALLDAPLAPAATMRAAVPAVTALTAPAAFTALDGALGLLVEYILATAHRPQPILAVAGALTALGVLAGRRYRTATNLRTNLYVVGMAESGGGKDHARKCITEAFHRAGLGRFIGGSKIGSGSGLLSALHRQPACLFQLDEFGQFLAGALDKRRAPKHITDIWDNWTELYTTASSTFFGTEYADQRERPRQDIVQPCCGIHATTTPGTFWAALQSGSMIDGSLARFLIFQSDTPIPDRAKRPADASDVPEGLAAALRAIVAGADVWRAAAGNLADAGAAADPKPCTVPMEPAAEQLLDGLADELTDRQREAVGTPSSAILARVWENVAKVALVRAVSAAPDAPTITADHVRWAIAIVTWCTETMMAEAERFIADNDLEAEAKRVHRLIARAGEGGITRSELFAKTRFLTARRRAEILAELVESRAAELTVTPTKTKPIHTYRTTLVVRPEITAQGEEKTAE